MNITLRIGEIVIEGVTLTRREREQIGATVQQELAHRLSQRGTGVPGAPRREGSALGLRIAHEVLAALPAGTFPGAGLPVARLDPSPRPAAPRAGR
jgi:hypothetical protein